MPTCVFIVVIFLAGRFGWKLFGFSSCESVGIEEISYSIPIESESTAIDSTGELHDNSSNEVTKDEDAATQVYAVILKEYYTAIEERWNGQQLLDAGMNFMIADCYGV